MRALAILLCVGGCASEAPVTILSVCPEPVVYSHATQLRAQAELRAMPDDAAVIEMLRDYARERAMLAEC